MRNCSIVNANPETTSPAMNSDTAAYSAPRGPLASDHAPQATMPMTLVASVPANATAYSACPSSAALTTGMTVVTASASIAPRKISAIAPAVTQTRSRSQIDAAAETLMRRADRVRAARRCV